MGQRTWVGTVYADITSTGFTIAVADSGLKRLDYVEVEHDGNRVLGQIEGLQRQTDLSYEQALAGGTGQDDKLSAHVAIIGYPDARGRVQVPRTPFASGQPVHAAGDDLVVQVLGLEATSGGAHLGLVKGGNIPVHLSLNALAQKHVGVLAKTGAGKSYTVGVLLEEFLKAGVPLVILDPHGEYGSLRRPNMDDGELDAMRRFGVKPKGFHKQIKELALDTALNEGTEKLVLEGLNLEGRDIVDLLPAKLSGAQVGVLYQAVKEVKEQLPAYSLRDVMDAVGRNKAASKWNVLNALEALEATGVFDIRGTPLPELVVPQQATIVNLKGVSPDVQEVTVARLTRTLWEARKRGEVPPHILVVEEAHNFCPERGVGNSAATAVIRTVASEGRKFGMGLVVVSQRPAKIDKNVLSQCNTQLILKVTNPNDVKAVVSGIEGLTAEAAEEVQRLPVGVAVVAGGGLTNPVFVDIRPRLSSHGGKSIDIVAGSQEAPAPAKPAPQAKSATAKEPEAPAPAADPWKAVLPPEPAPSPAPAPTVTAKAAPKPEEKKEAPPVARAISKPPAPRKNPSPAAAAPPARGDPFAVELERVVPPSRPQPSAKPALKPKVAPPTAPQRPRVEPPRVDKPNKKQQATIGRVVGRIGLSGGDAEQAVRVVRNLAAQNGRDAALRLGHYLAIGESVCLPDEEPHCIRCPERASCQFHEALLRERTRGRSFLRRLWRTS
ncbi:MAG: helicase HerA domain-containing protein [Thermoplasmatota archaeon]